MKCVQLPSGAAMRLLRPLGCQGMHVPGAGYHLVRKAVYGFTQYGFTQLHPSPTVEACNTRCCALCLLLRAGSTYFDSLQQEASFITTTNDPAGVPLIAAAGSQVRLVCATFRPPVAQQQQLPACWPNWQEWSGIPCSCCRLLHWGYNSGQWGLCGLVPGFASRGAS